jgi:N-acetylmuramoyl-L-alanine amidase
MYNRITISSGHGKHVQGAVGILNEVDEARRVVDHLADELAERGCTVSVYHDNVSTSQGANLDAIVSAHNHTTRELDISVHFNAHHETDDPMGVEVLYVTQGELAAKVSAAIAECGFKNRGAKKRDDLAFLNGTEEPAILIEICFVDSTTDASIYLAKFDAICCAIADALAGKEETAPPPTTAPPDAVARIDIEVTGDVLVYVNGIQVGTKG